MQVKIEKQPITRNLLNLSVGENIDFPIERVFSIRQTIVNLSIRFKMVFKTSTDRVNGIVTVTRIQ
jgi:hypothetical protein